MAEVVCETLLDPKDHPDVSAVVKGLRAHNRQALGEMQRNTVAVIARDPDGTVVGGAWGELEWDWLHIQIAWVDEARRRRGIGRDVIRAMEAAARDRGIDRCQLETTSFQSLAFYQALGYEVFGEIEKPIGHRYYFLSRVGL